MDLRHKNIECSVCHGSDFFILCKTCSPDMIGEALRNNNFLAIATRAKDERRMAEVMNIGARLDTVGGRLYLAQAVSAWILKGG